MAPAQRVPASANATTAAEQEALELLRAALACRGAACRSERARAATGRDVEVGVAQRAARRRRSAACSSRRAPAGAAPVGAAVARSVARTTGHGADHVAQADHAVRLDRARGSAIAAWQVAAVRRLRAPPRCPPHAAAAGSRSQPAKRAERVDRDAEHELERHRAGPVVAALAATATTCAGCTVSRSPPAAGRRSARRARPGRAAARRSPPASAPRRSGGGRSGGRPPPGCAPARAGTAPRPRASSRRPRRPTRPTASPISSTMPR